MKVNHKNSSDHSFNLFSFIWLLSYIFSFPFPSSKHNHHPHFAHTHLLSPNWSFIKVHYCHIKIQYVRNQNYILSWKKNLKLFLFHCHHWLSWCTSSWQLGFTTTLGLGILSKHIPSGTTPGINTEQTSFCPEFFCLLIYSQALLYPEPIPCTLEVERILLF